MLLEHCETTPEVKVRIPVKTAPDRYFHLWISARNHTHTSKTMEKAIAAIGFLSGNHDCLEDFVDDTASLPVFSMEYDPDGFGIERGVYLEYCHRTLRGSALLSIKPPELIESTFNSMFEAYSRERCRFFRQSRN
ncbi:hypothetical protein QFC20_006219 [Naganishia adeliensis]|uniref:Uncharacterized protein n=1 Tax=Naganishia adeliensis TaxID=92952 RepID=A0ACC2VEM9_9TREE|nr:hypothetical protein QFC20_006219 [Naganishia adeliensis]